MTFNIERFKSEGLNLGGARPSLFEIEMSTFPGSNGTTSPERIRFLAKASSIPPSVVESIDIPYFGRKVKIIGDRVFPNWSITVMNDEDFLVRNSFMNWHEQLNGKITNIMSGQVGPSPLTYKANIVVKQYSKGGFEYGIQEEPGVIFKCTLVGAFPVTVDAIQLDWDAINQVEQFDVEFAYDYWISGELTAERGNDTADISTPPGVR
jgi:hypothetical protein